MVAWKAVSNTSTLGILSPNTLRAQRRPCTPAGLCRGARGDSFSYSAMTSSVTSTLSWKASPPWTPRWPMAPISLTSLMALPSPEVIFSTTLLKASTWVGMGQVSVHF